MTPEATAAALARALPALRLNQLYPVWRTAQAHLRALAVPCPESPLQLIPGTAWPDGAAWTRVRVDHGLAAELLASLPSGGGRRVALQRTYLTALARAVPLPPSHTTPRLVEATDGVLRVEVVHDTHALAIPLIARTTVRLAVGGADGVTVDGHRVHLSASLQAAVEQIAHQPAAGAALLGAFGTVEQLTVGTLGPARTGLGGPWLSAALTRITPELPSSRVDDPLRDDVVLPAPERAERMSHIRKWAVPASDVAAARAWLRERGSRNLVYPYRLPAEASP